MFSSLRRLGLKELWIEFGQGKNQRWISVHDINSSLSRKKALGLPFFHAFSGCDVVLAFRGKGKKTAWQTWNVCPEVTSAFRKLSKYPPPELSQLDQKISTMQDLIFLQESKDRMIQFLQLVELL